MMNFKKVTCYGSGVVGAGWATSFLMSGLDVTLFDIDPVRLSMAKKQVEDNFNFLADEGVVKRDEAIGWMEHLECTSDAVLAVKNADFIQENGPENLAIKQSIMADIESNCRPDAVIASSTSGFLISDISAKATLPQRFIGAHPYNPVHLIPLVEMTRGEKTDQIVLEKAYEFYKQINKEPIILRKETPGFISNRLQVALLREATDLVHRGVCTIDEVDRALYYGPGLRLGLMGSHAIFQLTGGPYGIEGALKHIGAAMPVWFADMASWTEFPGIYQDPALIQKMTNEALAMRTEEQGRDTAGLCAFRDRGLVHLLKFHKKL